MSDEKRIDYTTGTPWLACDIFRLMMDWDSRNVQGVSPLKKITELYDILFRKTVFD